MKTLAAKLFDMTDAELDAFEAKIENHPDLTQWKRNEVFAAIDVERAERADAAHRNTIANKGR
jgi:hypothetical protein